MRPCATGSPSRACRRSRSSSTAQERLDKLEAADRGGRGARRRSGRLPGDACARVPVLGLGAALCRLERRACEGGVRAARARGALRAGARRRPARRSRTRARRGSSPASTRSIPSWPGTLYNSLLYHAPDGSLALHHRKLVPTNHERLVWGQGDGRGLEALPTEPRPHRRSHLLGELHAARARFSLYRSGVEIYVASTADDGDEWQATLRPHRLGGPCVRDRAEPFPARIGLP